MTPNTQQKPSVNAVTAAIVAEITSPRRRVRLNTFGFRLFSIIMGGAIFSIAGVTFLFSETVKNQAEEQIQKILEGKVGTIHEVTDRAETLADSLSISVATLHVRRAETPETFQELTRKLFEKHPDYVVGLGFGQKENGILPSQQWFYPYYQATAAQPADEPANTDSTQTTASSDIRYVDRAARPYFYPRSRAYQNYFLPRQNLWTAPYSASSQVDQSSSGAAPAEARGVLLSYYSQIYDNDNEWLGTAVVDIDSHYLSETIDGPIYRGGGQLILASEGGDIIANPANPENIEQQTFDDIPGLTEIWPKINTQANNKAAGLIEGERGYWSYARIPQQSWIVLSYVPYRTVFGQIVLIALSAVLSAGLLMAGLTALVIRYLNQRLRPVINECQRLSTDHGTAENNTADNDVAANDIAETQRHGKDELEQLSISFFNLLEQLKLTQTKVQLEAAHATEVETQLSQIKEWGEKEQQRRQSTLSQAQDYVLASEEGLLTAHQDIRRQTELIEQLQQRIANFEHSSQGLNQKVSRLSHKAYSALSNIPSKLTVTPQTLTAARAAALKLTEQLEVLSKATQNVHHQTKAHQNISSTAQVLLMNASTLAISASRPQSPETHEEIVNQLRNKGQAIKALSKQLEDAYFEQQQNNTHIDALVTNVGAHINTFDQSMQKLYTDIQSMVDAQSQNQETNQQIYSASEQVIAANQQLMQQVEPLYQRLQQLEFITQSVTEQLSFILERTQQVRQIQTDFPPTLAPENTDTSIA